MARKSRHDAVIEAPALTEAERIYNTAIYSRLSIEDIRDRKDSDSIANQQAIIEQYIEGKPYLRLCRVFSDNGETGTNFQRPAWKRLIDECKAGKIDCIVVKDLSRLGRNYLETGEYLEKIFPLLGVRFIAISDGYDGIDAANGNGLVFGMKNLVNDIYAKDISRKSSSALHMKQKNGEFIGSYAAYGYMKTPKDKNKIVVDEETAPVVRDIFKWKAEGVGSAQMCRRLNEAGIPSPCKYRYDKGILKDKRYSDSQWTVTTIRAMLKNPVYLGHTAQGKHVGALYEGKGRKRAPQSEWVIVENTHPAIVDNDVFEQAQRVMDERTAAYHANAGRFAHFAKPENILKGLVFCADCHKPLYRYKSVTSGGKYVAYVYQCRTHSTYLDNGCPKKYMHETELLNVVYQLVRAEIDKSANIRRIVERLNRGASHKSRVSAFDRELEEKTTELRRVTGLRQAVYEDFAEKLLTEQEFHFALGKYDADTETLKQRIAELRELKSNFTRTNTPSNKWLAAFQRFYDEQELTAEMARALIERIEIKSDNDVTVTWNFRDEYAALLEYSEEKKAVNA